MRLIYEDDFKDYIIYQSNNKLMCSVRRRYNPNYIIKQFDVYNNQDELNDLPNEVRDKLLKEMV